MDDIAESSIDQDTEEFSPIFLRSLFEVFKKHPLELLSVLSEKAREDIEMLFDSSSTSEKIDLLVGILSAKEGWEEKNPPTEFFELVQLLNKAGNEDLELLTEIGRLQSLVLEQEINKLEVQAQTGEWWIKHLLRLQLKVSVQFPTNSETVEEAMEASRTEEPAMHTLNLPSTDSRKPFPYPLHRPRRQKSPGIAAAE